MHYYGTYKYKYFSVKVTHLKFDTLLGYVLLHTYSMICSSKLGIRYPPVGALAYRRGKARASDFPPQ